jgi:hypothetical protein
MFYGVLADGVFAGGGGGACGSLGVGAVPVEVLEGLHGFFS